MREPKAGEVPRTRSLPRPSLPSHRKGHRAHLGSPFGVVVFFWAPGGPRFPLLFLVLKAPGLPCVFYTAGADLAKKFNPAPAARKIFFERRCPKVSPKISQIYGSKGSKVWPWAVGKLLLDSGGGGGGVMIFPFPRNITQYTLQLVQRTEIRKRGKIGTFESRTSRVTSSTGRSSTREGGAGATRTTPLEPKRGAGYFATP